MQDIKDPRTWSIEEIWNFISAEEDVPADVIKKVRDGINIKMHIGDILNARYFEKEKKGKIVHLGKVYKRRDMYVETEDRRRAGVSWILKEFPDKEIAKRRELDTEESNETKEEKKEEKIQKVEFVADNEDDEEELVDEYDIVKETMEVHSDSKSLETDHVIANRVPLEDRFVRKQHKIIRDVEFLFDPSRHKSRNQSELSMIQKAMLKHQETELKAYLLGDVHTTNIISRAREGLVVKSVLKGVFPNIAEKKHRGLRDLIPLLGKKESDL